MHLSTADIDFLTSTSGQQLLKRLAEEDLAENRTLPLLTLLRRETSAENARAALEMARLRLKARDKFSEDAARMLFTRAALEQASDPLVRRYRGQEAVGRSVVDACCGIGADALAMAAAGGSVTGLDLDEVRIRIARCNAQALGLTAHFQTADVRAGLPEADLIFFDPARRDDQGRRIFSVGQYVPPLSLIRDWRASQIMVKLSPGVDLAELQDYDGEIEFISVDGALKEAVLRVGGAARGCSATLLSKGQVYHWQPSGRPALPPGPPQAWLIEPDPALLRAGLVTDAALAFEAVQLDETIAYLTSSEKPASPWARAWKIVDWMPFHIKRLRAYLREHDVGHLTVKKRGFPMSPEEVIAALKPKGSEARTLVLTRCQGAPVVLICEDIEPG